MSISFVPEPPSGKHGSGHAFGRLASRRNFILAAVALGAASLWFGWPWLVVAGAAPLLLALAPCLLMCGAMCAMNLCMKPSQADQVALLGRGAEPLEVAAAPRPGKGCAACD